MKLWKTRKSLFKNKRAKSELAGPERIRRRKELTGTLILAVGMLLMACIYMLASTPERYNLVVGSIAPKTITATRDVVDEITTVQRRQAAAAAVQPSYHPIDGVEAEVLAKLNLVMDEMKAVVNYSDLLLSESECAGKDELVFADTDIAYAESLMPDLKLAPYQLTTLLRSNLDELDLERKLFTSVIKNTLAATISEGQEEQSISSILNLSMNRIDMNMYQNVARSLLRACILPNMVIDNEATQAARQIAYDAVEDVIYKQGENIVESGTRVKSTQLEILRSLGLLADNRIDMNVYMGALIIYVLLSAVLYMLILLFDRDMLTDKRKMSLLMLSLVLTEGLSVVAISLEQPYFAPVALAVLLLTGMVSSSVAITANTIIALVVAALSMGGDSAYAAQMVYMMYMVLVSGPICALMLHKKSQRTRVLLTGILISVSNAVVIFAIAFLTNSDMSAMVDSALWALGGGILSALLAVSFQPIFEVVFNLATTAKLLELANPNQPLLRRLLIETPGTYHHSIVVGNLAEAAAESVGANPLLARVGAYYHDIGKLKRPNYFKENQMGENPHEKTDPYVSAAIVTSHTRDGVQLAQKARLPFEVQQIIAQHHGDTPVMYFYYRAVKDNPDAQINIKDFRYDGEKPTTKEAAVVMLADTIEAAVRTMKNPTPEAIEDFIIQLVRSKLEDGQLSMSPLTFAEMDKICEAFATVMNGVFHERIEYPSVSIKQIREKNEEKIALTRKDTDESGVQTQEALLKRQHDGEPPQPIDANAPQPPRQIREQKPEAKPEVKAEAKAEAKHEVKADAKAEIKTEVAHVVPSAPVKPKPEIKEEAAQAPEAKESAASAQAQKPEAKREEHTGGEISAPVSQSKQGEPKAEAKAAASDEGANTQDKKPAEQKVAETAADTKAHEEPEGAKRE